MSGRSAWCIAGFVLVLGACSGDDGSAGDDRVAPPSATAEADEPVGSTAAAITTPTTTGPEDDLDPGDAPETVATDPPTTTVATTVPPAAIDVGRTVVQMTPTSGNSATPTLAWEAVDGAASYTVVVADDAGSMWWSWEGAEMEVVLGGVASGAAALQTEAGVTWTVFAHGEDGVLLAASPIRPLDP